MTRSRASELNPIATPSDSWYFRVGTPRICSIFFDRLPEAIGAGAVEKQAMEI
jgi:hypothetical protein